ncbi:hypothetical protein Poly30_39670 [Planctomycetes bacterium Poly30]|uniref:PDZ domain-containing protein n=1 Tax=Saltatorellus ferox TaxID=2528018 RepID=A0A518EWF7_9BACT|nr:hypothetical protein Poly30_39670 [Planctomycetes bacterium Poly30]
MNRLSASVLLAIVLVSAFVGFGAGFVIGQNPGAVAASEVATIGWSPDASPRPAAESPPTDEQMVRVGERLPVVRPEDSDGRLDRDPAAVYEPPTSMLNSAVRRTKAPAVEMATGEGVISGIVTTPEGDPLGAVEVHATPAGPGMRTERASSARQLQPSRRELEEVLADAAEDWARSEGRAMTATTGPDGRFRIEGLADLDFRVRAQAEGYSFDTREYSVLNPVQQPDAEVKIQARPLIGIRVLVVDESGAPRDRAIVVANGDRLEWTPEDPIVYSTAKQFQLQAFGDPLVTASTRSSGTRFISETIHVDAIAEPDRVVTLTLEAACIVSGRIVGENVKGQGWQNVYAVPVRADEPFDATVPQPDDIETYARDDLFLFNDLIPGRYAICLIGSGNVPVDHEIVEVKPGVTELVLDREVHDPSKYIRVTALSPRGTVVESYGANLEYQKPGGEISYGWVNDSRLPDGSMLLDLSEFSEFDYDAWPAGSKAWLVGSSAVYGKVTVPLTSGQREVTVQFLEPCELTVQLEGDISMGGFRISVKEAGTERTEPPTLATASQGNRRYGARIDARGVARFRALSPGPVIVELSQTGQWWGEGREISRQELVLSGKEHRITLEAPPVSDLEVLIAPCKERRYLSLQITEEDGEEKQIAWINTSEDGRAVFRSLPAGEYKVKDNKSGASAMATVPGPLLRIDLAEHVTKLAVSLNKLDEKLGEWGLAGGDLIVAIDGEPIEEEETLMDKLHKGDVTVTVERGEETLEIKLTQYPRKTREANPLGGWISIHSD